MIRVFCRLDKKKRWKREEVCTTKNKLLWGSVEHLPDTSHIWVGLERGNATADLGFQDVG
jgi:hypothetical protein